MDEPQIKIPASLFGVLCDYFAAYSPAPPSLRQEDVYIHAALRLKLLRMYERDKAHEEYKQRHKLQSESLDSQ